MSVSYHSYVVFGVPVDKDWLMLGTSKRGCKHALVEGANFCGQCGKPTYIEDREMTVELNEKDQLSFFASTCEDNDVVLGFCMAEVDDYNGGYPIVEQPTEDQKQELIKYCEHMDIKVDDDEFKMYMVQYCSY